MAAPACSPPPGDSDPWMDVALAWVRDHTRKGLADAEQRRGEINVEYLLNRPGTSREMAESYRESARKAFESSASKTRQPQLPEGWGR